MTTTPTVWKNFTSNFDSMPGLQTEPSVAYFADGSFLVTWTDDTKGTSAGTDIFAQRFDAEGNARGSAFQLNTVSTAHNESEPQVNALPDGGFIVAYAVDGSETDIVIERRDASGRVVHTDTLDDVLTGFGGFSIAVSANGDYAVQFVQSFEDDLFFTVDYDQDVYGFIYDFDTNVRSNRFETASNFGDSDYASGMTALAGGGFAFLSFGSDTDYDQIFAKLIGEDGSVTRSTFKVADGTNAAISGLTGGNFVVTYERGGDIFFRVLNPEVGASNERVAAQSGSVESRPVVTQLQDGGFFIAWFDTNGSEVRGQRFDASGTAVGSTVLAFSGLGSNTSPDLHAGVTSDGRIHLSVEEGFGGIRDVILDPRDDVISGTSGNDVLTTRLTATTVFAGEGNDEILGQKGNDIIHGEAGDDTIQGGGGTDTVDAGEGNDRIVLLNNHASDNIDGGGGRDMLDLHLVSNRAAVVDLSAGSWLMTPGFIEDMIIIEPTRGNPGSSFVPAVSRGITGIEHVSGTQLGDRITGTSDTQSLVGNGGDDTLSGAGGIDVLNGGIGNDTLNGGGGKDRLLAGDGADKLAGGKGADILSGGEGSDQFIYDSTQDGIDRITDFVSGNLEGDDIFLFNGNNFGGLDTGGLNANQFEANSAGVATLSSTRFVYDTDDGILSFDADGSANGGVSIIATLQTGAFLTISDIAIF